VRRPRASLVSLHSGGPGQPSAGIKTGCPFEGWTRRERRRAEARRIRDACERGSPLVPPGSYGAGDRNRRDGAPRGARVFAKTRPRFAKSAATMGAMRRSVPSAFCRGQKDCPVKTGNGIRRTPRRKEQGRWRAPSARVLPLVLARSGQGRRACLGAKRASPPRAGCLTIESVTQRASNIFGVVPAEPGIQSTPRMRVVAVIARLRGQ
jgi:hypothetical protein